MSSAAQSVKLKPKRELPHDPRRLKRRRLAAGLNLRQLSAAAGVSTGAISMIERGLQAPHPTTLVKLSRALECQIEDLLPPQREKKPAA